MLTDAAISADPYPSSIWSTMLDNFQAFIDFGLEASGWRSHVTIDVAIDFDIAVDRDIFICPGGQFGWVFTVAIDREDSV